MDSRPAKEDRPGAAHTPKHITEGFWSDLFVESENFLSGVDDRVSQLWHFTQHVGEYPHEDPGIQMIATRDFRLLTRSMEVRQEIYEEYRLALREDPSKHCGSTSIRAGTGASKIESLLQGKNIDFDDMVAASYGAYNAHVLGNDMRTDEGHAINQEGYKNFIFNIDKRYKIFKRLPPDNKRIYWDVILSCWNYAQDAFCVSFFPSPWISDDVLDRQPTFAGDVAPEDLYSGANGILTASQICELFTRGVLVIVPINRTDRYGCRVYCVRIMDPKYPHLDDTIFPPSQPPPSIQDPQPEAGGCRSARSDLNLANLTFRALDGRRLIFGSKPGKRRPLDALLFWQFATAMVKITWQVHPNNYEEELPELHKLWSEIWPSQAPKTGTRDRTLTSASSTSAASARSGTSTSTSATSISETPAAPTDYLTLGTTLCFSHLLNNPPVSGPYNPRTNPSPLPAYHVPDAILYQSQPGVLAAANFKPPPPPFARLPSYGSKLRLAPALLLSNEILLRTPHPSDAPRAFALDPTSLQLAEDAAGGMVTWLWQHCVNCRTFEKAVFDEVDQRSGDKDAVAFVHHHVRDTVGQDHVDIYDDSEGGAESPESPPGGWGYDKGKRRGKGRAKGKEKEGGKGEQSGSRAWDHSELRGRRRRSDEEKDKRRRERNKVVDINDCEPCTRRVEMVKSEREAQGRKTDSVMISHHLPPPTLVGSKRFTTTAFGSKGGESRGYDELTKGLGKMRLR